MVHRREHRQTRQRLAQRRSDPPRVGASYNQKLWIAKVEKAAYP
jgi:hypothetical protein